MARPLIQMALDLLYFTNRGHGINVAHIKAMPVIDIHATIKKQKHWERMNKGVYKQKK